MISNSGASNYTDYRSDPTRQIQFELGTANNKLSVSQTWSAGVPTPAAVRAWIDFNGNGIFESSEALLLTNLSTTSTVTSTFNIPALSVISTISPCGVTMRVISSQTVSIPSCGTFMYGEVEDYGVILKSHTLAVEETAAFKEIITISPNPASDVVHISGVSSQADFEIFTAAGQKAMEGKTSDGTIRISHLAKGVYFIQIKNKENLKRLKLIKK
ncbi:T9SS type A sorting domain-containing protein [Chryseobacterium soli]|nr:GEVED domain-containing protein [Chryseobacterium soli]MDV7698118.1 T9SS type A sorting domain-containing protein [Chryseobacterium soli]